MSSGKVLLADPADERRLLSFEFDYTLDSSCDPRLKKHMTQEKIFLLLGRDIVEDLLNGSNVTVLAYRQTSSGKSYTMFGCSEDEQQRGIIPRVLRALLEALNNMVGLKPNIFIALSNDSHFSLSDR